MKVFIIYFFVIVLACDLSGQTPVQTVRGVVIDKKSQSPLGGATVQMNISGKKLGSISNSRGEFKIKEVPVGRQEIKASFIGYETITLSNILVNSGKETVLKVEMEENMISSKELIVTADKNQLGPNNDLINTSVVTLKPEAINRFAGSRADPSRMAASSAGVAGGDDNRNDIIVRGNSPMGVLWRLEGVDIPNPNHFAVAGNTGGPFAILNNNLLANSDFLTGAFPAEYGNKTAAVFDVKLRNGNNERNEYTLQVGMNGLEAGVEGPFAKDYRGSYLANFRYMTLKPLVEMGIDLGENVVPEFFDGTFKLNLPTEKHGDFTLWGIFGKSKATIDRANDNTIDWNYTQRVKNETADDLMFALGLSHTYFFNYELFGRLNISASEAHIITHNEYHFKDKSSMPEQRYDGLEGNFSVNYTLNYKINSRNLFKAGVTANRLIYDNNFWEYDNKDKVYYTKLDSRGGSWLLQSFVHWQHRLTENFETNLGLYVQDFTLNNTIALEPRWSMALTLNKDAGKIGFAYGMHSQAHPLLYYQFRFNEGNGNMEMTNKKMDFMRAHHLVLNYSNRLWDCLNLKFEAYYQYLYDVPVSLKAFYPSYSYMNLGADFSFQAMDSTVNRGKGKNYGIEITIDKQFGKGYYILSTISLFRSQYTGADSVVRSTAFDIGKVFNLLAGREFALDNSGARVIALDVKMCYAGGRRIIPIDVEKSIQYHSQIRDYYNAYSQQLKDYFRCDLKISYNINLEKTTHNFFIAVDNIFNNKNVYKQEWNSDKGVLENSYQVGLMPYLGYRVNF